MSRNALLTVKAINAAVGSTVRDFSSVLYITDKFDIADTENRPVAITSVNQLKEDYSVAETDDIYINVRDYFGSQPKPDLIWVYGVSIGEYSDMLNYLDESWAKNWFYTLTDFVNKIDATKVSNAIKGLQNEYLLLEQGQANLSISDHLSIPAEIKMANVHYTASDVKEGQSSTLVGTIRNFFPGSMPYAAILLNGLKGCSYSTGEIINLVGTERNSMTGVNVVHEEDRLVVPFYGKSSTGTTWFDYEAARIAIDEYLRVGLTNYIIRKNTSGNKIPANDLGASLIIAEANRILDIFIDREIIYEKDAIDSEGNTLFSVGIRTIMDREVTLTYSCVFKGAIIKTTIELSLTSIGGN